MEEEKANYKIIKIPFISKDSKVNVLEDIFILERILENFIPFFYVFNCYSKDKNLIMKTVQDIILFIGNYNNKSKKKKGCFNVGNLKSEEKEFLYKTYLSSSHSELNTSTSNSFKIVNDDTLQINSLSDQIIRSLLIIIKEELSNNNSTFKHNNILITKLSKIRMIVLNESKPFDYIILSIFLMFIVKNFCLNLEEIVFEGTFYGKVEQIEVMLKNGVLLHFIMNSEKLERFSFINKIEFINENIAYKILNDFCIKEKVSDINLEKIIINKINIFNVLIIKTNIKSLKLKKISIDKNSFISSILDILENNYHLRELEIDKFVSMTESLRDRFLSLLKKRNLRKVKISIMSSTNEDLPFLFIPKYNLSVEKFSLKLGRCINENFHNSEVFHFEKTNLRSLSLKLERLVLDKNLLKRLFNPKLRNIALSHIDFKSFDELTDYAITNRLKLCKLHIIFIPFNEENYDLAYGNIVKLLEECKFIKEFLFENFNVKYKNIFDAKIKTILTDNYNLRKLIISSHMPFHIEKFEGFYYTDYPKYKLYSMLYAFKKCKKLNQIAMKKTIISNVFSFYTIRKEKDIQIAYKV